MKVSVLMPVYNEEQYIEEIASKVLARPEVDEIVIINDGSTDTSLSKIQNLKDNERITLVNLEKNCGKATAIRKGLEKVTGEIVLIQDADLEYDPGDYPRLLEPFEDPNVKVVYGSRTLKKNNKTGALPFYLGGLFLSFLTSILFFAKITDEPTCYKVFRTEILKSLRLKSKGFEFCPEVTAKVLRRGIKIREVPISYYPRRTSEGKKISWRDGLIAIWTLIKYRVSE